MDLLTEENFFKNLRPLTRQPLKHLNQIKSQSSLPQVGCVRDANTFPSHNQCLTHESLTRLVQPGFPSDHELNY